MNSALQPWGRGSILPRSTKLLVAANNSIRYVELTGTPKRCRLFPARRESHGLRLISAKVSRSVLRANAKGAVSPGGGDILKAAEQKEPALQATCRT